MKTQSQNEKISENLFGAREGCVGPDYSASLSHLFLSLNHICISHFLHRISCIRSVCRILAWLRYTCSARRQRGRHDAGEGMAPKEGVPEVRGDKSTCKGRLIRVSNVGGAKVRSWSEEVAARVRQRG